MRVKRSVILCFSNSSLLRWMSGGNSPFSFGRSKHKLYEEKDNKITFQDVAGIDEPVAELREIAKATEHEAVKGYTQMNKDHLLQALCKALGIDAHLHRHHHAAGEQRTQTKARIRALRNVHTVR